MAIPKPPLPRRAEPTRPNRVTDMAALPETTAKTEDAAVRAGTGPAAASPAASPGHALPRPPVAGGPPPGAATAGVASSLARTPSADGGPLDAGVRAPLTGAGASPPGALSAAAARFLRGRQRWLARNPAATLVSHSSNLCVGSRYWEHNPLPDESIDGINPPEFFGPHPIWEGFAVPVKRNGKTNHYYCTFCKKVFFGGAKNAYSHMMNNKRKLCQISVELKQLLYKKEKAFSQRRMDLTGCKHKANDELLNLEPTDIENKLADLMVQLSCNEGHVFEDGTMTIVCSLLEEAEKLLERDIHPLKIANGYEEASKIAVDCLEKRCSKFSTSNKEHLVQTCMKTLPSNITTNSKQALAQIAVDAVLTVSDMEWKHVNLDLVKVEGKSGGEMEDSELIYGVAVNKDMSHPKMLKEIVDARIAILTCSFEFPYQEIKHTVSLNIVEKFQELREQERRYFVEMVQKCKDVGATLVICQRGFDEEANHFFMEKNLPVIGWVHNVDLELIAIATGGRMVTRFQDLSPSDLGKAGLVREKSSGTSIDRMLYIEQCVNSRAVTILVRGGNEMVIEDTKRILCDTLCVARNLICYGAFAFGGGSAGVSCCDAIKAAAHQYPKAEQHVIMSFAAVLDNVPLPSAENALPLVDTPHEVKAEQVKERKMGYVTDFFSTYMMKRQKAFNTMIEKYKQQILLATRVVKTILKIGLILDEANAVDNVT
ncbi:hypothetical protein ACP70R_044276 [Stipagrostis hirtigluma subsp. patula]